MEGWRKMNWCNFSYINAAKQGDILYDLRLKAKFAILSAPLYTTNTEVYHARIYNTLTGNKLGKIRNGE